MIMAYRVTALLCLVGWAIGCSTRCLGEDCLPMPLPYPPHSVPEVCVEFGCEDPPMLPDPVPETTPDPPIASEPVLDDPIPSPVSVSGLVRLDGRAFADDDGPFPAWGLSLFWGLWAAREDPGKLAETLDWAASWGVDYVRVLSMVGSQPFWRGREIDPHWDDYWDTLDSLLEACRSRGLRVQITIFADAQTMMPDQQERIDWVTQMAAHLNDRRADIQLIEVANESGYNGLSSVNLAELTRRWNRASDIPVAPSSPNGATNPEDAINELFANTDIEADLLTPHFERRTDTVDGFYRPHRQPWEVQGYNTPTTVFTSNEPIGPGSSTNSENDPARLAIGMAATYISGGAGHVLHSNAGVRGDVDYWSVVSDDIMRALRSVHALLPGGIANGQRCNHHWDCHPYETDDQIWPDHGGSGGVVRAYASTLNGTTYIAVMGMRSTYTVTAKWPMTIEVFDVRTGQRLDSVSLDEDQSHVFRPHGSLRDFIHRVTRQ